MSQLPELRQIENCIQTMSSMGWAEVIGNVQHQGKDFPIHKVSFGSRDPKAPVLGIVGGVHGLERIGAQVAVALLGTMAEFSTWDATLQRTLENIRIFFIPMINPVGIAYKTRSNGRGVDLMRNAPVDAENAAFLVGGQRYSHKLPWYRGIKGAPMEYEAQLLVDQIHQEITQSAFALTVDLHSGFGFQDRLWFPYARTTQPFPGVGLVKRLDELLLKAHPHHFYKVEPQAETYTTHGDLWDYIYDRNLTLNGAKHFLPLCLEMGSWMWVKKNPWQIFSAEGSFNPVKGHRQKRTLRRHHTLLEFLIRLVASHKSWVPQALEDWDHYDQKAKELWYEK